MKDGRPAVRVRARPEYGLESSGVGDLPCRALMRRQGMEDGGWRTEDGGWHRVARARQDVGHLSWRIQDQDGGKEACPPAMAVAKAR